MSIEDIKQHFRKTDKFFNEQVFNARVNWILEKKPEHIEYFNYISYYIKDTRDKDILFIPYGIFRELFFNIDPELGFEYYKHLKVKRFMEA